MVLDGGWKVLAPQAESMTPGPAVSRQPLAPARTVVWRGQDLDGDGAADIANPSGHAPRTTDAYGSGAYGASRDGGSRRHAGVDYVATAGQTVSAPISGFVTRLGYAYGDSSQFRYVEIVNPALNISARVLYVEPGVEVGQPIAIGQPIGVAQSLQGRYHGITNHVHLELADAAGRRLDPSGMLLAQLR